VKFSIYRFDPDKDATPYMRDYDIELEPADRMLLDALERIKTVDDSLSLRRSCREGVCGSDGMNINGRNGLAEVAAAGVTFIRTGRADWSPGQINSQIAAERALLDAAHAHGLQGWLWLGDLPNLPAGATSPQAKLLASVADGLQGHAALGAYKAYVAWAATPDLQHWDRLGTIRNGTSTVGHVNLDKFLLVITAESDSAPKTHVGPTVLHGTSPSGWLQSFLNHPMFRGVTG